MTSRERILRTVRGEETDRIPIWFERTYNPSPGAAGRAEAHFSSAWKNEDVNYRKFIDYARKSGCEILQNVALEGFDRRFLLIPKHNIERKQRLPDSQTMVNTYTVSTPRGPLNYEEMFRKNISTMWLPRPLVQTAADAEKLLSVPYEFQPFNMDHYLALKDYVGENGVVGAWVSTPLVCVSHLLDFTNFLTWCIEERKLIDRLLETVFERIYLSLEYILKNGVGPIIRFGGSEQATAPMMSPAMFEDFVVKYDEPLMRLVHEHGSYVHVHCHGKLRGLLGKMAKMGVDMTDPVEGPPSGDITLEEARRQAGPRMTLIGNIQYSDLEFLDPDEMFRSARAAIEQGAGEDSSCRRAIFRSLP